MTIRTAGGEHVVLDADYLEHGWVDHAYEPPARYTLLDASA